MNQIVEIHIDSLTLHGFQHAERHAVAAVVQQELTRLLKENGLPDALQTGTSIPLVNAGAFQLQSAAPSGAGEGIAGAVYNAL